MSVHVNNKMVTNNKPYPSLLSQKLVFFQLHTRIFKKNIYDSKICLYAKVMFADHIDHLVVMFYHVLLCGSNQIINSSFKLKIPFLGTEPSL